MAIPPLPDEVIPKTPMPDDVAAFFPSDSPWSQLPAEPDELYAMFCFYLAFGPTRNLRRANDEWYAKYGNKRRRVNAKGLLVPVTRKTGLVKMSTDWGQASTIWRWNDRAARFDVYTIRLLIPKTAGIIFECVELYASKVHEALSQGNIKPKTWKQISESLETITRFVSPETVSAATSSAIHNSRDTGVQQLSSNNEVQQADEQG